MMARFITFEGGEGAGKTTQIKKLAAFLEKQGQDVVLTREPGGTPEAETIRDLVVQRDGGDWAGLSEVLLFSAARHEHVSKLIKPALSAGKTVICDRFSDSTLAYQGYGQGLDLNIVKQINNIATGGLEPDLTFILDIDVKTGLQRSTKRLDDADDTEDRFERMDLAFHDRIRQGFLDIAYGEPKRFRTINASQDIDTIFNEIKNEFV